MRYPSKQFRQFIDAVLLDLLQRKQIKTDDISVTLYLMQHADDDVFTVVTKNIALSTGLGIRTIQRALKRLFLLKVIEGRRRIGKEHGYRLGNLFTEALLKFKAQHKVGCNFDVGYGEGKVFSFVFTKNLIPRNKNKSEETS